MQKENFYENIYNERENIEEIIDESSIDMKVYMGACNNAQVMFWSDPESKVANNV